MVACQAPIKEISTTVDESQWEGKYVCDGVSLLIEKESDYEGIAFTIAYGGKDFKEYAYFLDEEHLEAISDLTEDGYTFELTLEHDKVIVKESGGVSYLGIELSGEYVRE